MALYFEGVLDILWRCHRRILQLSSLRSKWMLLVTKQDASVLISEIIPIVCFI